MSIHAREYEHSIATQAAEKLYHSVISDLKPLLKGDTVPNVSDAKRLVALAVSCGRDSQSFEKKGLCPVLLSRCGSELHLIHSCNTPALDKNAWGLVRDVTQVLLACSYQ